MQEDREFSFNVFWGPSDMKPYVSYSRSGKHYCIYCGKESDTREHIPSKVFLNKPYPDNLAVLPACKVCNNSFSDDELYVEIYIDAIRHLSGYETDIREENKERIYKNTAFQDAQKDLFQYYTSQQFPLNIKINRILVKLAIGHMVYELSEGYNAEDNNIKVTSVKYKFLFDISNKSEFVFDDFVVMNDKNLPIVGSRVFEKILVLEPVLRNINSDENKNSSFIVMTWTDVQDGNYRYIAWYENDNVFYVRIVIREFLFAEIIFKQEVG